MCVHDDEDDIDISEFEIGRLYKTFNEYDEATLKKKEDNSLKRKTADNNDYKEKDISYKRSKLTVLKEVKFQNLEIVNNTDDEKKLDEKKQEMFEYCNSMITKYTKNIINIKNKYEGNQM